MDIQTIKIGDRTVAIKGIGRLFYQEGFPLSMAISHLGENNIEVSLFHVADELLKTGDFGMNKRGESVAYNRIAAALDDTIIGDTKPTISKEELYKFCISDYETQREMIYQYLFGGDKDLAIASVKGYLAS